MNKHERKQRQRQALADRCDRALDDMYHNATPSYPDTDSKHFLPWFEGVASSEIDYINDGGAYGGNYRRTLEHNAASKGLTGDAAWYYVRKGMRDMRREREKYARWENITEFGKVYQWGRGGRTLAPDGLIKQGGGSSFCINDDFLYGWNIASIVELTLVVEAFNAYVEAWCKSVPSMWAEYEAENLVPDDIDIIMAADGEFTEPDRIRVYSDAAVDRRDNGAWVQAWVYVDYEGMQDNG